MDGSTPSSVSPLPLGELEAQITALAGQLNAAQYRWLMLIAEFDRRLGWGDGRLASCAHWLNFKCGLNIGAAREKVRVAHALGGLPRISASMARGELSYSKVRALTRVACPATEENLLMIALHGTAHHIESVVRLYRQALEAEELSREARQQANRSVQFWYDEDGSLVLKARLPALSGALVVKALEAALEEVPLTELNVKLAAEQRLSFQERRAEALAQVAESYLQRRGRSSSSADRYQVVLHVDAESLYEKEPGRCQIEHGPTIPMETLRRVACESDVVKMLENERGEALDVGRKTRAIAPALRRALTSRDQGCCRFPGCTYRRRLDAHHVEHWADGGKTNLGNLLTLCRRHHREVHEGGIRIEPQACGGWRFFAPDGKALDFIYPLEPPVYEGSELERDHAALGLKIDAKTAATRWRGERIDYDHSVWVLCQQKERGHRAPSPEDDDDYDDAPDVSAETFDVPAGTSDASDADELELDDPSPYNADEYKGATMANTSFEIVSVPVSDQERAKCFYRDVVGFDLVREDPMGPNQKWIQLSPKGCSTTIALVTWFDTMRPGGLQGVMLNVTDIDRDYQALTARGLKLTEIKQEPWGRYSMFNDPDGNGWILRQPPG
jgi:predicted enzyme related to lactoylglutathione lyase